MQVWQKRGDNPLDVQGQQLAAWIENDYDFTRLRRREIREATIVSIDEDEVIVDLGVKRDGIVPRRDLARVSDEYLSKLEVGDTVPVSILDARDNQDEIVVSLERGLAQQDWIRAEHLLESGETCEGCVVETNRGGVVVRFGRLRGFVPNSHLSSIRRGQSSTRIQEAKAELIGSTLSLAVIEVDRKRRRLVLSERAAGRHRREQLLEELTVGQIRTGVVCNLVSYGAFVDLGGIDGMIHISELDWKRVSHPSKVLRVGETIQVYVLKVDRERNRIGLSRKRLLPDPWAAVVENIGEGDIIEGTVTNTVDFGAFVDIGSGIEGLVHISQIPGGAETCRTIERGAPIHVRVLKVDPWRKRISLSLQRVPTAPVTPDTSSIVE